MSEAFASTLRHQLRRARWSADPADPPLGGADLPRRHVRAHDARLLHGRVPQAARDQLAVRLPAVRPGHVHRLHRLLAPGRPALRHRCPLHARARSCPCRSSARTCRCSCSAGSSRAATSWPGSTRSTSCCCRASCSACWWRHLILVFYHKHTQFAGPGKTEQERRRHAAAAGLHGQGRRLLLPGLRCHRGHRRRSPRSTRSGPSAPTGRTRCPPAPSPTGTWASPRV